ncbi:MAG: zinc carboxypeptidase [Caldisericia bacterium]|nr:zinc carboxypeptidase [Caldisericia bacterium]
MKKILAVSLIFMTLLCGWQPETQYLVVVDKPAGEVVQVIDGKYHCIVRASQIPDGATIKSALPTFQALGQFHDYAKVGKELRELEVKYPGRCSVYDIGDSIEGRDILAIRFQPLKPAPAILFVGEHHAREWMSVEVPMALAKLFAENPEKDQRIEQWLSQYDIWIVPMLNPDGHQYSIDKDRLWRKNRRPLVAAFGVDLNRNYAYKWSNMGASGNFESDIYQGADEFSEPETQAIRNLADNIPVFGAITFHTYGNMIIHSWNYGYEKAPYFEKLRNIGLAMAKLSGPNNDSESKKTDYLYEVMEGSKLYPASGDMCDYLYSTWGAPTYTYEMTRSAGGFVNDESEIQPTVDLVVPMALEFFDALPKEFCMVYGKATDGNGNPVATDLFYKNIEFAIKTDPQTGRFHHVLPKGQGFIRYKVNGKDTILKVDFQKDTNILNLIVGKSDVFDLSGDVVDSSGQPFKAIVSLYDQKNTEIALFKNVSHFSFKSVPSGSYILKVLGIDQVREYQITLSRNLSITVTAN